MSAAIEAVRPLLDDYDARPAAEIARAAGLPLEQAYEALVALEGAGQARVLVEWDELNPRGRRQGWLRASPASRVAALLRRAV